MNKYLKKSLFFFAMILFLSCGSEETEVEVKIKRFDEGLIIPPLLDEEIGSNVQGPSLIKVPDWIENPLGNYYLYFADHKGDNIKMAYSDSLEGPWKIKKGGTLQLKESFFLTSIPETPEDFDFNALSERTPHPALQEYTPKQIDDLNIPHIASPDVHVDYDNELIVMYFHGLNKFGSQKTRVATSSNGIEFKANKKIVGWPYFRRFTYDKQDYALSMPGVIYKRSGGIEDFDIYNQILEENVRHSAVLVKGDVLLIFFTKKEESPERIYLTTVDLSLPLLLWTASKPVEVLRPEKDWEGANLPLYASSSSAINTPVNQLRDPAVFEENDKYYLLYSVRGENGIAISNLYITD